MGSGDSNSNSNSNSNKVSALNNLKAGQPVSARELVEAISELAKTVSSLNRAVVQLQSSLRTRAGNKNSFSEKEEDNRPPKIIH